MKKIILVLLAMAILSGCSRYTNISQIQDKVKKSDMYTITDSIQKGDTTTYYFYAYYGESFRQAGWYCWEYLCDKNGLILKKKEFWVGSDKAFEEFRKNLK